MEEMTCFTFIWKIVNFSFYETQNDLDLPSPSFKAGDLKWKLHLCPKVGLKSELFRLVLKFHGESTDVQLNCELSFLASDGTVLRNHKVEGAIISKSLNCICADFLPRTAIFGNKRDLFLPQDTLTVRCRLWKNGMAAKQYSAQTVFHRKNLIWNIRGFDIIDIATKSIQLASRHFDISLCKSDTQSGFANIEIVKTKGDDICSSNCKICIISADGKERATLHDYDSPPNNLHNPWSFPIILRNEDISSNGTLSLQWEFTVGVSEVSGCETQSVSEQKSAVPQTNNYLDHVASSSNFQNDMLGLYRAQKLCDATLRTGEASFQVHKCVLGARSSVLCAIFENETGEYQTDVDIPEVDRNILEYLILFLYTDSLENINWEEASKLYYAADKYSIHLLKEKCLSILKAELSFSNVCQIVLLAHTNHEKDLMQFVQEFICEHDEIIYTQEWSRLEESNPQLTIKLLRAIAMNLKK